MDINKSKSHLLRLSSLALIAIIFFTSCTANKNSPAVSSSTRNKTPTASPITASPTSTEPARVAPGTIAFTRTAVNEGNEGDDIYIIQTDGTGLTRLTEGTKSSKLPTGSFIYTEAPAWSPDGTRIVYDFGYGDSETYTVWVMNADGSEKVQLTQLPLGSLSPSWSPDGSLIAFSVFNLSPEKNNIYLMNADGSNQKKLTDGIWQDLFPKWSPEGKIFFLRRVQVSGSWTADVFAMNPDGSGVTQITAIGRVRGYALSPDGKTMVYHDAGLRKIMSVPTYGQGSPVVLSDLNNLVFQCPFVTASWSPNGKAIAFGCSDYYVRTGGALYIVNADGSGLTIIPNTGPAMDPVWRPE
jgi:Tol biopolymer transport system component